MLGTVARSTLLGRNYMKNFIRNGSHGGVIGENMPFDMHSKTKLTINMFLFVATGIGAPFLIVLHQLRKNSN